MPRGYVDGDFLRCQAYYEFKDVPVKGRVYRYWYFRVFSDGKLRSIYCGKQRPELSPLAAAAAFRDGTLRFSARSRKSLPKPRRRARRTTSTARGGRR